MSRKDTIRTIHKVLSDMRQDDVLFPKVMVEAQQPAAETDPDYAVNNYPRLLQLVRAGLVPEEMISKMTNILKDPKRFGVSPKVRDELYTIMIKTLNYIVVSDPAAWARFRQYLLNTQVESTQMKSDIFSKFKKALHEESTKINFLGNTRKSRQLSEELLAEAARHQPGEAWIASTGESYGGKNKDGEVVYYNIKRYKNAENLAKIFASGKISKQDALSAKTKVEGKRKGQLFGTGGAAHELKKVKHKTAASKNMDGPDNEKQAIGSDLAHEQKVSTRLFKIAEIVLDRARRKRNGEDVGPDPNFDLCTVTIPGTNLFCGVNLEIPRIKMPQLKTLVTAGSPAEALLKQQVAAAKEKFETKNPSGKDENGKSFKPNDEVNAEGAFLENLKKKGISFKNGEMASTDMKATQNELDGAKVMSMANTLVRPNEVGIKPENLKGAQANLTAPLIVSRDGYVLDGHHRWAAVSVKDLMEGRGENPTKLNVIIIDMEIEDLVEESNDWGNEFGLERKGHGQQNSGDKATTKKESTEPKHNVIAESLLNSIRGFVSEEVNKIRLSIDKN